MSQTFLTENPPIILDATCSYSKIWPAHASLRLDIRKEVKPDIVADAGFLPFRDEVFDVIYCDPPHMIRKDRSFDSPSAFMDKMIRARRLSGRLSPGDFDRYGRWPTRKDWLAFVGNTNIEFHRALKHEGVLHYKITETKSKEPRTSQPEDLKSMDKFEVVNDKAVPSRSRFSFGNTSHFITMRPKP